MVAPRDDHAFASNRPFPSKLQTPEYPAHFEIRKVSTNGGIRWHSEWVNVSHLLGREHIGLEQIDNDIWTVTSSLERERLPSGLPLTQRGVEPAPPRLQIGPEKFDRR